MFRFCFSFTGDLGVSSVDGAPGGVWGRVFLLMFFSLLSFSLKILMFLLLMELLGAWYGACFLKVPSRLLEEEEDPWRLLEEEGKGSR